MSKVAIARTAALTFIIVFVFAYIPQAHGNALKFLPTDTTLYCTSGDVVTVSAPNDTSGTRASSQLRLDGRTVQTGSDVAKFDWVASDPGPHELRIDFTNIYGTRTKGPSFPVTVLSAAPIILGDFDRKSTQSIVLQVNPAGNEFIATRLEVFVDDQAMTVSAVGGNFQCKIDPGLLSDGHHTLKIEAYDAAGGRYELQDAGFDTPARIIVPPPGTFTRTAGTDRLIITPSFCSGWTPQRVDYYVKVNPGDQGQPVGKSTSPPFSASMDLASMDTGNYFLYAVATDNGGNTYTSSAVPLSFTNQVADQGALNGGSQLSTPARKAQSTPYSFTGSDGAGPVGSLVQGRDGNLYGTTAYGGAYGYGTAFKITPDGELTTLHSFTGASGRNPDGNGPASLVQGSDGNFYGTTSDAGTGHHPPTGRGTVYRMTPGGVLTTMLSLGRPDLGTWPAGGVVQGADGNFYGTTSKGGSHFGTVFRITPGDILTTLHSFTGVDGMNPTTALVLARDGSFYGTTKAGGLFNKGAIFKITPGGDLTSLHSFAGTDGVNPTAGLVQSSDGDFYGTTDSGGSSDLGTVFKVTPNGILTTLYSFSGTDGSKPIGGLVQGSDGAFYGTTSEGGPSYGTSNGSGAGGFGGTGIVHGDGTVFRITHSGVLTTLYSFAGTDGSGPVGSLLLGRDGSFYGATQSGGYRYGTIFKITVGGKLTTLHSFTGQDWPLPYGRPAVPAP